MDHVKAYLQLSNVELVAVCDTDERRMAAAVETAGKAWPIPEDGGDFCWPTLGGRRVDRHAQLLACPATILACAAGKHVMSKAGEPQRTGGRAHGCGRPQTPEEGANGESAAKPARDS